jgi:putative spermidine/putrescine transport system substrate-binding protein
MLSRRKFIVAAATATAATTIASPFLNRTARAAENKIRIIGVETAALKDWTPFTKETGLEVEFTGINADAGEYRRQLVANAAGDDYDLFIANGGLEDQFGKDYFFPLDEQKIPNWSSTNDGIRKSTILRTPDGQLYAVPAIANADSFGYYTDEKLGDEPLSWSLLFEDDRTKGKVALEDNWATTLVMAATFLRVSKGVAIGDPSNMTADEAKKVVDYLINRKKAGQFRALWTSFDESIDLMDRKEVIASNVWEPAVKALQAKNKAVKYADAKEGYFKWMIAAYVFKQVGDRGTLDTAYKALGGFLGGAYAAEIAKTRGYSTGRPTAGLEYASANGYSPAEVDTIKANIAKTDRKFKSDFAWANIAPDNMTAIESEWDRFRQA